MIARATGALASLAVLLALTVIAADAQPFALIGNAFDHTVSIIDTAAVPVTVIATVPISGAAAGIAVNPVRTEAYAAVITDAGLSALSVIDTATLHEVAVIPLSVIDPTGVAVSPDGTRAWVTGGFNDVATSIVNLLTRTELTTVNVSGGPANPGGPIGVTFNPVQRRAYVAFFNQGLIGVYDTATNNLATFIILDPCPIGCAPLDLAVSPDGSRLYATDFFSDVVWVIDAATNQIITPVGGVSFPESLVVHPDGTRVFVANLDDDGAGRLSVLDAANNVVVAGTPVGAGPLGVAVEPASGRVYVVNGDDNTVTVLDAGDPDLPVVAVVPVGDGPMTFGQFITPVPATIRFSSATYDVTEGTAAVNAVINVVRDGAPAATVTVPFRTVSGGTATAGSDYTATSRVLTFGPGVFSQSVTVPVLADALVEGDETVNLVLDPPVGLAVLGAPNNAVLTIHNVGGGTVQFSSPTFTVSESGANAVITVVRVAPLLNPVTVTFSATPLTAVAGQDFTPVSGTLTFASTVASRTFNVPVINDTGVDGARTVGLALGAPTGGAQLGTNATAVLTIQDNDQGGVIKLSSPIYTVSEAAASVVVTLVRTGTNLAGNVSVSFATANASALSGLDYTATVGTVTFNAGETTKPVSVPILADTLAEGNETFTFALSAPTGGATLGTPASATVTITDNDTGGVLRFSSATYRATEAVGSVVLTVLRTGTNLASGVLVDFQTLDGNATSEGDYSTTRGTLTFVAGQASATITVPIQDDEQAEGDEAFQMVLTNPRGGATLGTPATATVTIPGDLPTIQFSGRFNGNQPEVVRTGPLGGSASVQFQATNGTAILGEDFTMPVTGTLVFPPGVAAQLIPLVIVADIIAEGPETFTITLMNPSAPARLGPASSKVFTISDNDFGGSVQFGAASYLAAPGQTATITILRSGDLRSIVIVNWARTGGTAVADIDFSPASGSVTFGPGDTSKTFSINALAPDVEAEPRTVELSLSVPPGAATLGARPTTVLTIALP